jgi:hypothetical protein
MALQQMKLHYEGSDNFHILTEDSISALYACIEEESLLDPCAVELDVLLETKEDCIELMKVIVKIMSELEND